MAAVTRHSYDVIINVEILYFCPEHNLTIDTAKMHTAK